MSRPTNKRPWALFSLVAALISGPILSPHSLSPANAADVTTGLVAYWNFENGSTLGTPFVGSLNLTNVGSPVYTNTGGNGGSKGLSLNGSSYLQSSSYPASLNGNNPYTIAAWFNTTQGNNGGILGYGSTGGCLGNNLRLNGATYFYTYWYGCDYLSGVVADFRNAWHHIAATYDGTTLRYYYDGALLSSNTGNTRATTGTQFVLGKTINDVAFSGVLDDVAIYTRALSLADVQDLRNGALNFNAATTVSLSVASSAKTAVIKQTIALSALSSVDGKVTFHSNGKNILGCISVNTVSLTATCSWKPSVKGPSRLTAQITPTQVSTNAIATSATYWIQVLPRTGRR